MRLKNLQCADAVEKSECVDAVEKNLNARECG
jgi:hypothetical protein